MKTIITLTLTAILLLPVSNTDMKATAQNTTAIELTESLIDAVNNIDIVSLNILLAEGADVDTVNQNGDTPLMLASKIGNPRILRIILAHNPNINAKNNNGETALMIASKNGQHHVAQELIHRGANLYERNYQGLNSVELAARNGHTQIVNLLRNKQEMPYSR